jgi:hypothetical protein
MMHFYGEARRRAGWSLAELGTSRFVVASFLGDTSPSHTSEILSTHQKLHHEPKYSHDGYSGLSRSISKVFRSHSHSRARITVLADDLLASSSGFSE